MISNLHNKIIDIVGKKNFLINEKKKHLIHQDGEQNLENVSL